MVRKKEIEEEKLKKKTRELSIKEGVATSIMDGAGSKYITPYALALGANNSQIGFLTSIPSLLGNFFQLFTSRAIEKYSRKKIVRIGVFLQALMWIPIILVGYLFFNKNFDNQISTTLLIVFYSLLLIFGAFISPAWNSLLKDNVPKNHATYLAKRNKIITGVAITVMLAAGIVLNYFKKINYLFIGFAIIFSVAFIGRLISYFLFKKHYEPKLELQKGYYFSLIDFIKGVPKSNFGKFSVFVALMSFGAAIASPFFAVYMLKDLQLDYIVWTLIIITNAVSSIIFMPFWGKFADKYGNLRVMKWLGALIPLAPLLWFSTIFTINLGVNFVITQLVIVEFFSGFIWSGFNLSAVNFIYDAVSREKLALCVAYYNIFNGVGVFIGANLGGLISSMNINILGVSPILFIFLLSAIMRFVAYLIMSPKIKEVRKVEGYKKGEFKKRIKKVLAPSPFKLLRNYTENTISTRYI